MRVAVLGASGFIGRHVCDELRHRHLDFVAVPRSALDDLARVDCECCIHLAESSVLAGDREALANTSRARRVVAGAFQRIVYVSSGVVYGDRATSPRRESDPVDATSEYARAKLASEAVFAADARCAIARLGNVYGRGMSPRNVLSELLAQVHQPGPMRARDLAPVRDYIEVRDVARALVALASGPVTGIVNIASGRGTSVAELAHLISSRSGQPARALVATEPRDESSHLVLAIERARAELHWDATIELAPGVSELIARRVA